ncbi:MAG: response regulator transcription factor [Gudongella sp.]|nr:response regulator transcription factor [Gudongella sp.]
MYNLLIVDDEEKIRDVIKEYCEFEGYNVDEAEDGMEAIKSVEENDYDLIVMDIMMPKIDGFTAVKEIRKKSKVPVLMLSARGDELDKLYGFELGIDDYVLKPFSTKELMARINAIIKRTNNIPEKKFLKFHGIFIDIDGRTVSVDNKQVELTKKEYELLLYLAQNNGKAISREELLQNIWGYNFYEDDRTIDTHIKMLRNNLKQYREYIITVRGVGYKFDEKAK